MAGLRGVGGEKVIAGRLAAGRPVLGICVGMQVLFDRGRRARPRAPRAAASGPARSSGSTPRSCRTWAGTPSRRRQARRCSPASTPSTRFYFVHSYGLRDCATRPRWSTRGASHRDRARRAVRRRRRARRGGRHPVPPGKVRRRRRAVLRTGWAPLRTTADAPARRPGARPRRRRRRRWITCPTRHPVSVRYAVRRRSCARVGLPADPGSTETCEPDTAARRRRRRRAGGAPRAGRGRAPRPPTATRSRPRWPGRAPAPSGCTWSTWTPPSAAGSNRELLAEVVGKLDVKVELSGGIRDDDSLDAALATGCARVNIGTAALENPDWVRAGHRRARRQDRGRPRRPRHDAAARGWTREGGDLYEMLARLDAEGCARYVVTDVHQGRHADAAPTWSCSATSAPHRARRWWPAAACPRLDDLRALAGLDRDRRRGRDRRQGAVRRRVHPAQEALAAVTAGLTSS